MTYMEFIEFWEAWHEKAESFLDALDDMVTHIKYAQKTADEAFQRVNGEDRDSAYWNEEMRSKEMYVKLMIDNVLTAIEMYGGKNGSI